MSGGVGQIAPEISGAIENLHAGSLIIDDIQDDSQTRRGQATMHRRIGMPLAINAGNWMYFGALECLSESSLPAEQRWLLLRAMVHAARRCHEGQAIDLHARVDSIPAANWHETTLSISTLKTGALWLWQWRWAVSRLIHVHHCCKSCQGLVDRSALPCKCAMTSKNSRRWSAARRRLAETARCAMTICVMRG